MKPNSLQSRIFSYGALFVSLIAIIIGLSFYYTMSQGIEQQIGERALNIAMTTADRPDILSGFEQADPTEVLQPIAEAVRMKTGAEYVVIGNSEGVRYAHPIPERIGKKMVGDDNERALFQGESYISEATGSLGPALRGKAPVFNEQGDIIGVISVGFLITDISSMFFQYADNILYIVLIAIILGVVGSSILARNIKKELFNLEPAEIAHQLTMELAQVKRYTEALRAQTHEYNNFLYTISGLIQLHSYEEALNLIHDETSEHRSLIQFVTKRLRDPFLGGIVIGFFNRAKELKVRFLLDEDSFLQELPNHLEKNHFVSIIGNLVTNAFEAVESFPEERRMVRIFILDNGEEILLEVEDSGPGIATDVLDALFQEKISTKAYEDRGYGLVKVAENVKDLGGSITLEKGDLGGALFIISIPKRGHFS